MHRKFETEEGVRLTTEVLPSPGVDGDSLGVTSRSVTLKGLADCSKVAVILTRIKHAVLQERTRVQLLVAILKRPRLLGDNAAVFLGFILAFLLA